MMPYLTLIIMFFTANFCSGTTYFLFSHGFGSCKERSSEYTYAYAGPSKSFDFPDAISFGIIDPAHVNLGQDEDIKTFLEAYYELESQHRREPDAGIVIIGSSRGGMTALNAASMHELPKLKAIVAIGAPDSLEHVVFHRSKTYHLDYQMLTPLVYYIITECFYPGHKRRGPHPIDYVPKLASELPIFLIHSKDDLSVPVDSSRLMYHRLKATGHTNVHYLELETGVHGEYHNGPEYFRYASAIHAFYKEYGIDYDHELARAGRETFTTCCTPSNEDILKRLEPYSRNHLKAHS